MVTQNFFHFQQVLLYEEDNLDSPVHSMSLNVVKFIEFPGLKPKVNMSDVFCKLFHIQKRIAYIIFNVQSFVFIRFNFLCQNKICESM